MLTKISLLSFTKQTGSLRVKSLLFKDQVMFQVDCDMYIVELLFRYSTVANLFKLKVAMHR